MRISEKPPVEGREKEIRVWSFFDRNNPTRSLSSSSFLFAGRVAFRACLLRLSHTLSVSLLSPGPGHQSTETIQNFGVAVEPTRPRDGLSSLPLAVQSGGHRRIPSSPLLFFMPRGMAEDADDATNAEEEEGEEEKKKARKRGVAGRGSRLPSRHRRLCASPPEKKWDGDVEKEAEKTFGVALCCGGGDGATAASSAETRQMMNGREREKEREAATVELRATTRCKSVVAAGYGKTSRGYNGGGGFVPSSTGSPSHVYTCTQTYEATADDYDDRGQWGHSRRRRDSSNLRGLANFVGKSDLLLLLLPLSSLVGLHRVLYLHGKKEGKKVGRKVRDTHIAAALVEVQNVDLAGGGRSRPRVWQVGSVRAAPRKGRWHGRRRSRARMRTRHCRDNRGRRARPLFERARAPPNVDGGGGGGEGENAENVAVVAAVVVVATALLLLRLVA
jgi:hypothetical protein